MLPRTYSEHAINISEVRMTAGITFFHLYCELEPTVLGAVVILESAFQTVGRDH